MHSLNSVRNEPDVDSRKKILIVDDTRFDLDLLAELVAGEGYEVFTAMNGLDAINLFNSEKPELVLLDVLMKEMDGYKLAAHLTEMSKDRFVPIIFVTTLDTAESVAKGLNSGGVDVLSKPYDRTVLKLKIETFLSLADLYTSNAKQRDELEYHNRRLRQNYEVAGDVFDKVMHSDVLRLPAIKFSLSPIAIFNGDILLAAYRPSGELQLMLGDFTGHGISAAIGAIPVADIFYGMTAKGFGIEEIVEEVNKKMQRILPRGLFLAACLFEFNFNSRKLSVWNAGLPDGIIYNESKQRVTERFESRNFPLGVVDTVFFSNTVENYYVHPEDHFILFTDGVLEARNQTGELYGLERVIDNIEGRKPGWMIDIVQSNLLEYTNGQQPTDDTTIFEIIFDNLGKPIDAKAEAFFPEPVRNSYWQLEFTYGATILRNFDPLPHIIQTIMEMQKLHRYKQDIFIIFKELFVNALDHGLLGMESDLKQAHDGFSKYIQERQKRLDNLENGQIIIKINYTGWDDGGFMGVVITDSGEGFDTSLINRNLSDFNTHHGRGIFMVNAICDSLRYNEVGNSVTARYTWNSIPN